MEFNINLYSLDIPENYLEFILNELISIIMSYLSINDIITLLENYNYYRTINGTISRELDYVQITQNLKFDDTFKLLRYVIKSNNITAIKIIIKNLENYKKYSKTVIQDKIYVFFISIYENNEILLETTKSILEYREEYAYRILKGCYLSNYNFDIFIYLVELYEEWDFANLGDLFRTSNKSNNAIDKIKILIKEYHNYMNNKIQEAVVTLRKIHRTYTFDIVLYSKNMISDLESYIKSYIKIIFIFISR